MEAGHETRGGGGEIWFLVLLCFSFLSPFSTWSQRRGRIKLLPCVKTACFLIWFSPPLPFGRLTPHTLLPFFLLPLVFLSCFVYTSIKKTPLGGQREWKQTKKSPNHLILEFKQKKLLSTQLFFIKQEKKTPLGNQREWETDKKSELNHLIYKLCQKKERRIAVLFIKHENKIAVRVLKDFNFVNKFLHIVSKDNTTCSEQNKIDKKSDA